jgi:23S rRNA pseudouridine2605 synthase
MASVEREDTRVHQEALRLNRFLALAGVGSRRKNDELILSGVVKVNGRIVQELGTRVYPLKDRVTVNGQPVELRHKRYYILFNKPKDCITTLSDEKGRTTVMDYVRLRERIYPIGRLDRNTTGVLLLTNDGDLAHGLMHPRKEIERVYRVRLERGMLDEDFTRLKRGIRLQDGIARPHRVELIPGTRRKELLIALTEGRNREVRRLFEALEYDVKGLERVVYAGLTTEGVARGRWRFLTHAEVSHLLRQIGTET